MSDQTLSYQHKIDQYFKLAGELLHGKYRKGPPGSELRIPYQIHNFQVVQKLQRLGFNNGDIWAAAIFHDVIEECGEEVFEREVEPNISSAVVNIVKELTFNPKKEPKDKYINSFVSKSHEAIIIKVADRICNVEDFIQDSPHYAKEYFKKGIPLYQAFASKIHSIDSFGINAALNMYNAILNKYAYFMMEQ